MAGSELDIDSVVNALLKEYGYGEPEPRENAAAGAGAAAAGKKEPADPGVLSRIAEKMAATDRRKEVYCEVCGLVKVKSGTSGVPVCERCYKRMSVLREGRKEAVEFYSDPRNTQRASRRVKKYIRDAIDAAGSRNLELRTEDIPARPQPKAAENPPAAPAPAKISVSAPAKAPAPVPAEASVPAPAKAPAPARGENRPAPAPARTETPAVPARRGERPSAAELLEQMDGAAPAAPAQNGGPGPAPAEEDSPLVAELMAQFAKTGTAAPAPAAQPPEKAPVRKRKHQAERTAPHEAKPPAEPAPPPPAPPPAPAEEAPPTLEEILAQMREEMPAEPAPAPAPARPEKRPAEPAPAPVRMERPAPAASRPERPSAAERPARTSRTIPEPGPARPEFPSLEEMLTPIGEIPPETAAERAAEAGRTRRKKQPAPPRSEKASAPPAHETASAPEPPAEAGHTRRKRKSAPARSEKAPAPPAREAVPAPEPPAAEPSRSAPAPEKRPAAYSVPDAPASRSGRRAAPAPAPTEEPGGTEKPRIPERTREEPSIEELLTRTEDVLQDMPPEDDGLPSRTETAAHARTERHLARSAAPKTDERAARKASRPAFALNRPCEACGADEWVGIDGAYSYIELCNNCEKRKVEFNKQEYVDNFECPNCGGLTGTREENKRKFGVRCSNCGELTICFRKVDELLMDEKLTAALTDYAKALVSDQSEPVTCPQCGSDSITSSGTGLFGNRTVNRCARCGYAWKPQWLGR